MKLTAQNVHDTFMQCLFAEGEPTDNAIMVDGVRSKVGFHPDRIKENEQLIADMLHELPDQFQQRTGGGWTFLNMCQDKNGNQWADLHLTMDELVCLGLAAGKLSYLAPRDMWEMFPGGMPYLVVNDNLIEA